MVVGSSMMVATQSGGLIAIRFHGRRGWLHENGATRRLKEDSGLRWCSRGSCECDLVSDGKKNCEINSRIWCFHG